MANLLDYIIPQTMGHVRRVDQFEREREKQAALETLKAFMSQPDVFEGVQQNRPPTPEVLAAYQKAYGTNWPTATNPNAATGGPPPGVSGGMPFASMDQPKETLAVMRSPLSQVSNEIGQRSVAEAMAKIRAGEATLANQGDLPTRQLQNRVETLGTVLKPYGYTDTDVAASVSGGYPFDKRKELALAKPDNSLSLPELALKAAGGDHAKAVEILKGVNQSHLRGTTGTAQAPPVVKMAQQFMSKFGPVISQSLPPMMQVLFASMPNAQEVMKAVQAAPIDPQIKQQYSYYAKILDTWTRAQMGQMGIQMEQPAAAGADQNDPLGILQ